MQGDGEEIKFRGPSSLIAATKSGAIGHAELASMMPFGLCMYHYQQFLHPKIHHIEKLRFLGISRYKFKLRFWFNLNLYREI